MVDRAKDNSDRWRECSRSLDLTRRAFEDTGWGRLDVVEGLCHAAYGGKLDVVEWICDSVETNTDFQLKDLVNTQSEHFGMSPLCLAASGGNLDVVQWLVTKGARMNEKNRGGRTEIHEAASGGHLSVLVWLMGEGECVHEKDDDGDTALHEAARWGHLPTAHFLVNNGFCAIEKNDAGETALDVAAASGHFAVIQSLGETTNQTIDTATWRNTALYLHWAVQAQMPNLSWIQLLVDRGVRVFEADKWGNTALFYAAVEQKLECVEYFLEGYSGDDKPSLNDLRKTLFAAAKADRVDLVEHLKNRFKIDVRFFDSHGRSALHEAAVGGAMGCVNLLLASGAGVHQTDSFGVTPVIETCRHGQNDVLKRLLDCEGNPSDVDMAGRTALHYAAEGGHLVVVNTLLAHGVDIDCSDKIGWTPLHCAAAAGHQEVVGALLDKGANIDNETIFGKTAIIMSVERGHYEVLDLLCFAVSGVSRTVTVQHGYNENIIDPGEFLFDLALGGKNDWFNVPVEVKSKKRRLTNFVEELDRWSKLSHPNVVQLFGVWYGENDEAYSFSEFATQGSLLGNRAATPAILWERLYGAALGLQYLHNRNIIHGQLNCDSIVIAENGLAKLRNFGTEHTSRLEWTSPEVLSGLPLSFESDIYAFGITIVETFMNGGSPWGFTSSVLKDAILSGKLPDQPSKMTASQWMLVKRMCCFNPRDRLSAPDIVRNLKMLLDEYLFVDASANHDENLSTWNKLSDVDIASTTVSKLLTGIHEMFQDATETTALFREVHKRLNDILNLLDDRYRSLSGAIVHRYCIILLNLHTRMSRLLVATTIPEMHFAAHGQVFADIFAMHIDLDVLLRIAKLPSEASVHRWQETWKHRRDQQMKIILQTLEDLQDTKRTGESEKTQSEEALTYLQHELNKLPRHLLSSGAFADLKAKLLQSSQWTSKAPEWFIPEYNVVFDNLSKFTDGDTGSAHAGKWNQAQVLVIKLGIQLQTSEFTSYVETWYKLHHPHVMKLFGACHVKQPLLVCEHTREQLDQYLHCHPDEIWRKLYEAALGLRYLHAKHVVHGNLNDSSFVVGTDNCVKITNVGFNTLELCQKQCLEEPESENDRDAQEHIADKQWKAPELFGEEKATLASDIFSFGTFILHAITSANPCEDPAGVNSKNPRPPLCLDQQIHDLEAQMHSDDPRCRPSASEVVRRLELLTEDFQRNGCQAGESESDVVLVCWSSLGGCRVHSGNATATVSSLLAEIDDKCTDTVVCVTRAVYERLVDIFSQLKAKRSNPSEELFKLFNGIIFNFHTGLFSEHHEDTALVHKKLDDFMTSVRVPRSDPIHTWQDQLELPSIEEQSEAPTESLPHTKLQKDNAFLMGMSDALSADRAVEDTSGAECIVSCLNVSKCESWFIPEYEVVFVDTTPLSTGGFGRVYSGKWRRADAVVKTVKLTTQKEQAAFLNEVRIWHKLNHPHVVQLFGACHIQRPFFVLENATGGQLDHYLKKHPDEVWNKLYEAAMGLQYLHEMGVIHGDLKCNNIMVGSDGLAKLIDFGLSTIESDASYGNDETCKKPVTAAILWTAPEVLRGEKATFASDIYAFGMCILEATRGVYPWWDLDGSTVRHHVLNDQRIPMRPLKCSETMYRQVERMCSFDAADRLSAADVVRRLEVFTQSSERPETSLVDLAKLDEMPKAWANLEDALVLTSSGESTLSSLLTRIDGMCEGSTTMDLMNQAVHNRLKNVFNQLKSELNDLTQDTVRQYVRQYGAILHFFYCELDKICAIRLSGMKELNYFSATRLGIEAALSVHNDVDLYMKTARLSWLESDRKWRDQWEPLRKTQQIEIFEHLKELPAFLDVSKERGEALELLRFEFTMHPTSYAPSKAADVTQAKHAVSSLLTTTIPDWFIPPHEVTRSRQIGHGGYSSVYLGEWKHARVAVKKIGRETFSFSCESSISSTLLSRSIDLGPQPNRVVDDFLNEAQIWYRLRHPHVVQMFGACHFGIMFFVCEYAGGGQLNEYLRDHPDEVWQKLYEVALGLRYVHSMGVAHGDLKCNNIVVGGDGLAKLADFGLSSLKGKSPPNVNGIFNAGAIQWKAPEVLRGANTTFASDIYSFGMCIIEAVSGKYPWGSVPDIEVKYRVLKQQFIPSRPENCSEEQFDLVERMCRFDPSERLTVKEVVGSLNAMR